MLNCYTKCRMTILVLLITIIISWVTEQYSNSRMYVSACRNYHRFSVTSDLFSIFVWIWYTSRWCQPLLFILKLSNCGFHEWLVMYLFKFFLWCFWWNVYIFFSMSNQRYCISMGPGPLSCSWCSPCRQCVIRDRGQRCGGFNSAPCQCQKSVHW